MASPLAVLTMKTPSDIVAANSKHLSAQHRPYLLL